MIEEISYVRSKLQALGHAKWFPISERTGVSMRTIKRVAYNEPHDFRTSNIQKLSSYFRMRDKRK